MATPFSTIYDSFLSRVEDDVLQSLSQTDLETLLQKFLISAATKFTRSLIDLSDRDLVNAQFNQTLGNSEIEILAMMMYVEYLLRLTLNTTLTRQYLSNSEWKGYSQANQLKELSDLRSEIEHDIDKLIIDYLYKDKSILGDLQ